MRIYTDEKDRLLAIWLSAEENDDASVMAALHPVIAQYKSMKYQPVIYRSGDGNLQETPPLCCATQDENEPSGCRAVRQKVPGFPAFSA